MNDIPTTIEHYIQLGYKPVPLKGKAPIIDGYLNKPARELWNYLNPNEYQIGLQCGINGLICFDADNKLTQDYLKELLSPFSPWVVKTKRGLHYWVQADINNQKKSFQVMKGQYKGEIRLKDCQTVAPPSVVDGHKYETINGHIENVGFLPQVLLNLFIDALTGGRIDPESTELPLSPKETIKQDYPEIEFDDLMLKMPRIEWTKSKFLQRKIKWLRENNSNKDKGNSLILTNDDGEIVRRYNSRSNVFQSVILTLIRFGYYKNEISDICYNEEITYHQNPDYQISIAIERAERFLITSPKRIKLQNWFGLHLQRKYRHQNDYLIYEYLLGRAMQFNSYQVELSKAGIMTFTGVKDRRSVENSLRRLESKGLVEISVGQTYRYEIRLLQPDVADLHGNMTSCVLFRVTLQQKIDTDLHIDLNTLKVLGATVKTLQVMVGQEWVKTGDIVKLTGLNRTTVFRHLKKLVELGLVTKDGNEYVLQTGWEESLRLDGEKHFESNQEKIAKEQERLQKFYEEQAIYQELKKVKPQKEALELIKQYELTGGVNSDLQIAISIVRGVELNSIELKE